MVRFRDWLRRSAVCFGAAALVLAPLADDAMARRGDRSSGSGGNSGNSSGGGSGRGSGGSYGKYVKSVGDRSSSREKTGSREKAASNREKVASKRARAERDTAAGKRYPKKPAEDTKVASKIYVPPKQTPPPSKKPPKPPSQAEYPPKYPPKDPPKYPRPPHGHRPVIALPLPVLPPYSPPVMTVVAPPAGDPYRPPRVPPTEPPRATPRPRPPMVVPPTGDVARSRDREVIIAMDDTVSDGDTITLGQGFTLNVEVQYRSQLLGFKIVRLRIPDNRSREAVIQQVIQAGIADPRIIAVQPNYVFETSQASASAALAPLPQYASEKVRLGEAHRVSLGRNVRVAVIDTGLDAEHPELSGAVAESFDAIGEGPVDIEAHGTAIAGIVAAHRQMTGTAPDARVLAVRAFSAAGGRKAEATTLSLIKGLDWAAANSARVVNMSFAGPMDPLLQETVNRAEAKGIIMVAAAGNGGPDAGSAYPAAYDRVIAVTASDSDDQLYDKANRGSYIAVAAPGVDILAPAPKEAYEVSSGTSLAAAHVSGIIALLLERRPTLTTEAIRSILSRTARDPDNSAASRGLGAGIVDAAKAVAEVQ